MKKIFRSLGVCLVSAVLACGMFGCSSGSQSAKVKSPLDAKNPTSITVWNYYNGDQLSAFDQLVNDFNSTIGNDEGIIVNSVSQGSIDNLANSLLDSAEGKVGAQDMPTIAAVYAETAYILDKQDKLVNLDDYFTQDELSKYIPGFIEEGRLTVNGGLKELPVSKSTECFVVNQTDWAPFQAASGISADSIKTVEDLTAAAKAYYEYTDGLTPDVPEDGKSLYGRDSVSNYMYIGAKQLGHELFEVSDSGVKVSLDKATLKTLWDNYYVPYVNGYFTAASNHRSEDVKTGTILAMTGSTSAASYLPSSVTDSTDQTHSIELKTAESLNFAQGSNVAVQQGAGYCVVKGTDQEQYAAVEFLKYLTSTENNLEFSISSGYSPVTIEGNDKQAIEESFKSNEKLAKKENMLDALLVSSDIYTNTETYTCKPFDGGKEARDIIGKSLEDACTADRAAVTSAIASGQTREQATANYVSASNFDAWYNKLVASIDAVVK